MKTVFGVGSEKFFLFALSPLEEKSSVLVFSFYLQLLFLCGDAGFLFTVRGAELPFCDEIFEKIK